LLSIAERRDHEADGPTRGPREQVAELLARLCRRDIEPVVAQMHRHHVLLAGDLLWDQGHRLRLDVLASQVGDRDAEELGQRVHEVPLVDESERDEHLTDAAAGLALLREALLQLLLCHEAALDEQRTESPA